MTSPDIQPARQLRAWLARNGYDIPTALLHAALNDLHSPKPPEPRGLGAVVEDAEGVLWTRIGGDQCPWHTGTAPLSSNYNKVTTAYCDWHQIAAVRVLSEGVTP